MQSYTKYSWEFLLLSHVKFTYRKTVVWILLLLARESVEKKINIVEIANISYFEHS